MKYKETYIESRSAFVEREQKPREKGLSYVRAPKVLGQYLADYLTCYSGMTDILKFVTNQFTFIPEEEIKRSINLCHDHDVLVAAGNPIMDAALRAGSRATREVIQYLADLGVDIMEISLIARTIDDDDLVDLIDYLNTKGIKPFVECGLSFAHSPIEDNRIFLKRKAAQAKLAMANGAWKVLIEAEGVFENVKAGEERYDFVDDFVAGIPSKDLFFEGDDQDAFCYYVDAFGPKANIMVDYQRVMQLEAARRGYGPNTSIWSKAALFSKE